MKKFFTFRVHHLIIEPGNVKATSDSDMMTAWQPLACENALQFIGVAPWGVVECRDAYFYRAPWRQEPCRGLDKKGRAQAWEPTQERKKDMAALPGNEVDIQRTSPILEARAATSSRRSDADDTMAASS